MKNRFLMASLALYALAGSAAAADDLAKNFASPPAAARPWVYWFWLNGNLTKEGMTADLEAMQRAGMGGVLIMEVDQGAPVGPVAFMSDQWRDLFKHMVTEASRLGIEVNMNNDAGWNGSGGPWVPLDKAMQVVVTSETTSSGWQEVRRGTAQAAVPTRASIGTSPCWPFPPPRIPANPAHRIQNLPGKSMSWGGMHGGSLDGHSGCRAFPRNAVIAKERIVDLTRTDG